MARPVPSVSELAGPGFVATFVMAAFNGQFSTTHGDYVPVTEGDQSLPSVGELIVLRDRSESPTRPIRADLASALAIDLVGSSIALSVKPGWLDRRCCGSCVRGPGRCTRASGCLHVSGNRLSSTNPASLLATVSTVSTITAEYSRYALVCPDVRATAWSVGIGRGDLGKGHEQFGRCSTSRNIRGLYRWRVCIFVAAAAR